MKNYKKEITIAIIVIVIAVIAEVNEYFASAVPANLQLERNPIGEGSYEDRMELTVEGLLESYEYPVEVPEQRLTENEEQFYLEAAVWEMEEEFLGENIDVNEIRKPVVIRETYQKGFVKAEWGFDNYRVMDFQGNIIAQEIAEEGELICATVEFSCGTSTLMKEFYFRVYPKELSEQEQMLENVRQWIAAEGKKTGSSYITLPKQIEGHSLSWKRKGEHTGIKILLLGFVTVAMLPFVEKNRRAEEKKKREQELMAAYSDMVSQLSVLLSAGMTVQRAWKIIAFSKDEKRKKDTVSENVLIKEMKMACRELESGMGEERVYERFGERCGVTCYRRLGNLLAQNIRKGNRGIITLLEKEAEDAFEERKQRAKRLGEEAGSKLLGPMMLMLGMVLFVLIVPAIFTFQL